MKKILIGILIGMLLTSSFSFATDDIAVWVEKAYKKCLEVGFKIGYCHGYNDRDTFKKAKYNIKLGLEAFPTLNDLLKVVDNAKNEVL